MGKGALFYFIIWTLLKISLQQASRHFIVQRMKHILVIILAELGIILEHVLLLVKVFVFVFISITTFEDLSS